MLIAVVVAVRLDQGWVPHDDGSFGQSAQRVLEGQLPHRDFVELYTGGMTFLNAGVFALFGENLIWLRLPLFVLFLASIPCFYLIARRFVSPAGAGLATIAGYAWGFPVYPAAVPSWYVLFFTIGGVAALLRHLDTGRVRWLVVAGVLGGLAVSFKIVGVYYVLGVTLYLLYLAAPPASDARYRIRRPDAVTSCVTFCALAVVASVLGKRYGAPEIVNLVVPLLAVSVVVMVNACRTGPVDRAGRLSRQTALLAPFVAGVLLPVALVSAPFVVSGSVADLVHGVVVAPQSRMDFAYGPMLSPIHVIWAVPLILAIIPPSLGGRWRTPVSFAAASLMIALTVLAARDTSAYQIVFASARELAPLILLVGSLAILVFPTCECRRGLTPPLVLLLLMVAFLGLVQYPFGAAVYYCYLAPIVVLATVGVARYLGVTGRIAPILLLSAYAVFAVAILDRGSIQTLGVSPARDTHTAILDSSRASIRVPLGERAGYLRVIDLLQRHGSGRYTFAGPDAPEVYFLADRQNPTRALFDFLDSTDSARGANLIDALKKHGVTAIAINDEPAFSLPLETSTVRELRRLYPDGARVGKFDVRWSVSRIEPADERSAR